MLALYFIFFLTQEEIEKNIRKNFEWIKNINEIKGKIEFITTKKDTQLIEPMTFNFEIKRKEKNFEFEIESNKEKIIRKENQIIFKDKSMPIPTINPPILDTQSIFPKGKIEIQEIKERKIIELVSIPKDTLQGILKCRYTINTEKWLIESAEIVSFMGTVYAFFEYQELKNNNYFYKKITLISQEGIKNEIIYNISQIK
ncbi:MAG: hypothetical protein QXP52_00785 [Candidatus Aenigmatarchaeota archaeon]